MAQRDGTHKIPPGDPVPRRDRSLRERFLDCLRSAKGGGGIDGITAAETIIIGSRMVFLGWELHELWEDTLNIRTIDGNLIDYLWRQRMPCVPKKTEDIRTACNTQ